MNAQTIAGPWFEDFSRGQEFDAPAVTLTEGHAALYQAMFGDRLRLALDHATSRRVTSHRSALAHPLLAINLAVGQSTWASQRVKANLFYRGLALKRCVHLGDTLYTRTRVVGLRQNKPQPERAATGMVALEITTTNQRGESVLHFWRCPMIPCRDPQARTSASDKLDELGSEPEPRSLLPQGWDLQPVRAWRRDSELELEPGTRFVIEARDSVTLAPELVRLTLNMAMAHTDARLSYLGERLVYGGHTISMAFAQLCRALPNLLTLISWERCDHTAPVLENDRLRSEFQIVERIAIDSTSLLKIHLQCFAARGEPESETRVLDWVFWVWTA